VLKSPCSILSSDLWAAGEIWTAAIRAASVRVRHWQGLPRPVVREVLSAGAQAPFFWAAPEVLIPNMAEEAAAADITAAAEAEQILSAVPEAVPEAVHTRVGRGLPTVLSLSKGIFPEWGVQVEAERVPVVSVEIRMAVTARCTSVGRRLPPSPSPLRRPASHRANLPHSHGLPPTPRAALHPEDGVVVR